MIPLDLAQQFHRAGILGDHFKQIPDDYLAFPDEKRRGDVTIRCVCGTESDLRKGQIASCKCGRVFWNGARVYAAAPPEIEPHPCVPDRLTLRSGSVVFTDYCRTCKGDIRA